MFQTGLGCATERCYIFVVTLYAVVKCYEVKQRNQLKKLRLLQCERTWISKEIWNGCKIIWGLEDVDFQMVGFGFLLFKVFMLVVRYYLCYRGEKPRCVING